MTRTKRAAIVEMIDAATSYDAATVQIHADGKISAIKDADKTFNGPHTDRLLVGWVSDFEGGVNPFRPAF